MAARSAGSPRRRSGRVHPFLRWLILGVVAYIVVGALVAVGLLVRNTQVSVYSLLAAGLIAVVFGGLLFVKAWVWSLRSWRDGCAGRAVGIAVAGGLAVVVGAGALAATIILLLTFGLG